MIEFAVQTGRKAGLFIHENFGLDLKVEHKGRIDLVTRVDMQAQQIIIQEIEKHFPDHGIVAEEGIRKEKESPFVWFVDPLDGTVNYVHGIPIFCVSLALYKRDEPYLGVCYNPISGELFWAQAGKGAYLENKAVGVSHTDKLVDALIVTGFPYSSDDMQSLIGRFSRILQEVQGIRRLGSAALDLCYVACGRFDGFWESGLQSWDTAAGAVIVQEAGGRVSSFSGSVFSPLRGEIVASNSLIHEKLIGLM
ncbi:MAG: inositol monophosphatase [Deltaproteobacteria bacterium]|nr:inositol monophosphatase [Deltaproteobacteria bacterium]